MLAKITLYDGTVYKIASQTVDTEDGIYLGRIKDELSIVSAMQEAGNAPETISLTIINYDNFIPHNKDLWAADVLLTNDNNISWRGKINFCNFDSDGNLYVTASEKTAPELELQLPDEVRQVYTIDEDFHQSSVTMTIPLVIGGTTSNPITLPTILIDKTRGIYLICVGEIRSIVNVYNGAEQLPQTAYTAYTGTADQQENAGFAYVQIAEDYRLNSDGSYAEINVDVVGLKLGNHTEAECRNGARFLYYFLTTAATGVNGWGCGIDSNLIDITSFNSAITLCDQLGYKLDGIMWLRQSAQSWIDQICQAIHGKYSINANGKRSLFIDYAGNASKKTFTASNMRVDRYGKNSYTSVVYNKGVLSYDYNPITGLFMQSAQYENADSIAQIGEQKFIGESYLIKDATTALAVLEYTCKRSQIAAEAIEFKTDDIETNLRAGDIITINRPDLNLNNALYQIQSISTTDFISSIIAVKFDTSVFSVTGTASTVNWGNERDITPALTPAQATNLLLSTGFDINPDGTGIPYISGTFTVPDGGWLAAAVQYGIGINPSNWTEMALITEGRFKLSPVNVDTVYSIRVRMITATGHSSFITGVITATGDTIPPSKPTISAKATDRTVTIQCGLDTPPADMGGFQIYRKKSTDSESAYTYIGSIAANRGYAAFSDYVDEYVTYNYKAKSYDRSGNLSTQFSDVASIVVTGIQANDVAATALGMPTGSILRLSAKNCTTASIAEANGVKDVSGNGNHGQAYGGVSVLDGGEGYSFDGTNDYISINSSSFVSRFTNLPQMTVCFNFINKASVGTTSSLIWSFATDGSRQLDGFIYNNKLRIGGRWTSSQSWNGFSDVIDIELNKKYSLAVVFEFANGKMSLYSDGVLISSLENLTEANLTLITQLALGANYNGSSNYFNGEIGCFRIYPRALTASEIKTIYMFPDDVTFGQLTADLIGANIIKAFNLVMTESVITNTAQIENGIITNAKISSIDAAKITTGTLDADRIGSNTITAEKIAVIGFPVTPLIRLSFVGLSSFAEDTPIPDISGYDNGFIIKGTWDQIIKNNFGWALRTLSTSAKCINNKKQISMPASGWTFFIKIYIHSSATGERIIFDCRQGNGNNPNRLQLRIDKDNDRFRLFSYNSSGTSESIYSSSITISYNVWYDLIVIATSSTKIIVYLVEAGNAGNLDSRKVTFTLSNTRSNLTVAVDYFMIAGLDGNTSNTFIGSIGDILYYTRQLSIDEIKYLVKNAADTEAGQITSERIATDAIKSRNFTDTNANILAGKAFSTQGSFFNLAAGTLTAPKFRFGSDGSCGIGGFTIDSYGGLQGKGDYISGLIYNQYSDNKHVTQISTGYVVLHHALKYSKSVFVYGDNTPSTESSSSYVIKMLHGISGDTSVSSNVSNHIRGEMYGSGTFLDIEHFGSGKGIDVVTNSGRAISVNSASNNGIYVANGGGSGTDKAGIYIEGNVTSTYGLYIKTVKAASSGGWSTTCDESVKKDVKDVSTLDKLKSIRVKKFKYSQKAIEEKEWRKKQALKTEENLKKGIKTEEEPMPEFKDDENSPDYIMAMAGEFNKAFGVDNGNEEEINYTNAIGVALRSIQELAEIVDFQKAEIAELKALLKNQQDEKSEIIEHFNDLVKDSDSEDELIEPSFDELLKSEENQEEGQKE